MSSSTATVAPERQSQDDLALIQTDSPAVSPLTETTGIDCADAVEGLPEPKSALPFFLIAVGLAIYFIAVAAYASFLGVAAGIFMMVVGGIVYACRGFARLGEPISAGVEAPEYVDGVHDSVLTPMSARLDESYVIPEFSEETIETTEEVLAVK